MNFDLLNLIPNEILNLIWRHVKPSIKYNINKYYFNKFYCVRFAYLNNKKFLYNIYLTNYNKFIITNYNYLKYLIKNNNIMFIKLIIDTRLNNNNINSKNNILEKKILFENKNFINIIDFTLFYAKKFKIQTIYNYIIEIIKKNNLTNIEKKKHKHNNNKLIKWTI
jgi:hypothetical protein